LNYAEAHYILNVVAHSAKADFCRYVLRTPTPKEMCYNDLLNQIAKSFNKIINSLSWVSNLNDATTLAKSNLDLLLELSI